MLLALQEKTKDCERREANLKAEKEKLKDELGVNRCKKKLCSVYTIELKYMERYLKQITEAEYYIRHASFHPRHVCVVFRDSLAE